LVQQATVIDMLGLITLDYRKLCAWQDQPAAFPQAEFARLKASGANVFISITTPKFAAQAIKKAAEIGWKPVHYLNNVSISVGSVMKPAGLDASQGIITAG